MDNSAFRERIERKFKLVSRSPEIKKYTRPVFMGDGLENTKVFHKDKAEVVIKLRNKFSDAFEFPSISNREQGDY